MTQEVRRVAWAGGRRYVRRGNFGRGPRRWRWRKLGSPAPDFTLKVYENDNYTKDQEVSLSDLRGKPVVINFWFPGLYTVRRIDVPHKGLLQREQG